MFCVVIAFVVGAGAPVDKELTLVDTVTNPVEAHFHGAGTFLFDGVIGDAGCGGVVSFDGGGWLRMSHLFKGGAKDRSFLSIDEEATDFRLGGRGHDGFQFLTYDVYDAVGCGGLGRSSVIVGGAVAEEVMASDTTASFG